MLSQLDSNYFLDLGYMKNSSPSFSDKDCLNCGRRKPGAADTHILETVGEALVNCDDVHRLHSNSVTSVLGFSKTALPIAGTALVLKKQG